MRDKMSFRKYIENLPKPATEEEQEILDEPYLAFKKPMELNAYLCPVCVETTRIVAYCVGFHNVKTFIAFAHIENKTRQCRISYEKLEKKYNYKGMPYQKRLEEMMKILEKLDEVESIDESIIINYED